MDRITTRPVARGRIDVLVDDIRVGYVCGEKGCYVPYAITGKRITTGALGTPDYGFNLRREAVRAAGTRTAALTDRNGVPIAIGAPVTVYPTTVSEGRDGVVVDFPLDGRVTVDLGPTKYEAPYDRDTMIVWDYMTESR